MKYLHGETTNFPIKPESFMNKNNKSYIFKIKDKLKTFFLNFSKQNFLSNKNNLALNQEGVLKQDFQKFLSMVKYCFNRNTKRRL